MPSKVPKEVQKVIEVLKKTKTKNECLKKAYQILNKRFDEKKFLTINKPQTLFYKNVQTLWAEKHLHCNSISYLLRILLLKSGKFKKSDIKRVYSMWSFISPHEFLKIRVEDKKWVYVDLWGKDNGAPFGKYAGRIVTEI